MRRLEGFELFASELVADRGVSAGGDLDVADADLHTSAALLSEGPQGGRRVGMADAERAGRTLQDLVHRKRPFLGLGRVRALVVVHKTRRIGAAGGDEDIIEAEVQHLDNTPWG